MGGIPIIWRNNCGHRIYRMSVLTAVESVKYLLKKQIYDKVILEQIVRYGDEHYMVYYNGYKWLFYR